MKKWVRNLLKGTSLSTALFVFQACYGMPAGIDDAYFYEIQFHLVDGETDSPVEGVDVMVRESGSEEWVSLGKTDQDGNKYVSTVDFQSLDLKFQAGTYQPKDTTLTDLSRRSILVKMYRK